MATLSTYVEETQEPVGRRVVTRLLTLRWWRLVVLGITAVYFVIPLAAATRFALQKPPTVDQGHGYWFGNFSGIFTSNPAEPFSTAMILTLELMAVTIAIVIALVVPTTVYIHLYTPRLRRVMDAVTVLPIVIPAIVLIFGVLEFDPTWLKSTPYLLSLEYVMLAMPYVYRSLDAGLRAVDIKTLVEASKSLGGGWATTLFRVLAPNLKTSLLTGAVLGIAVVFGEFTMASLDQVVTFQVWVYNTNQDSAWISTAASVLAFLITLILLLGVVALDRQRGRHGFLRASSDALFRRHAKSPQ